MDLIITILGFGHIGKQICSSLLSLEGYNTQINIIDISEDIEGALIDFEHAAELFPNHQLVLNDKHLFNKSDFVFHCAGASVPKGSSRLEVTDQSIRITEDIFKDFSPRGSCKIIVISNPVEVISFVTQKVTGLPSKQIVGTGTYLDSIRMNYYAKQQLSNDLHPNFVLLGEHGQAAFVSHQLSKVEDDKMTSTDLETVLDLTKGSAKHIKITQDATIFGVSFCAIQLFKAFLSQEEIYIPVSTEMPDKLCNQLNVEKIYLSLFSQVSQKGVFYDERYIPNKQEQSDLKEAYEYIIKHIPKRYLS